MLQSLTFWRGSEVSQEAAGPWFAQSFFHERCSGLRVLTGLYRFEADFIEFHLYLMIVDPKPQTLNTRSPQTIPASRGLS